MTSSSTLQETDAMVNATVRIDHAEKELHLAFDC